MPKLLFNLSGTIVPSSTATTTPPPTRIENRNPYELYIYFSFNNNNYYFIQARLDGRKCSEV
jgi:hypothetical protein